MVVFDEGRYARILDAYYTNRRQQSYPAYSYATTTTTTLPNASGLFKSICPIITPLCPWMIFVMLGGGGLAAYGALKGFKTNYLLGGAGIVAFAFLAGKYCCHNPAIPVIPPRPSEKPQDRTQEKPQSKPQTTKPSTKPSAPPEKAGGTDPLSEIGNFFSNLLKSGADNFKSNVRGIGGEEVLPLA